MRVLRHGVAVLAALLLTAAAPDGFEQATHPPAPDYSAPSSWMAWDGSVDPATREADVFFIHPTTLKSQDWNQDMSDEAANRQTDISIRDRQLSSFDACCRRFAPRYRQATSRAFTAAPADRDRAYALAYQDVLAAFRHFLATASGGRPFILAGHSQGALQGLRLLREEIAGTPLAGRLVVAYLPGIGIPANSLPNGIPACTTPTQTRCVLSWNSFTPEADTRAYVARSLATHGAPESASRPAPLLCINPVSFSAARPATDFPESLGAFPDGSATPVAGKVAAYCDGNVLRVRTRLPVETLNGGSLHLGDWTLFYSHLRRDHFFRTKSRLNP